MKAIYKRELKSYFQSMVGYAFIAFLMLFTGIYFTAYNLNSGYPYFGYALSGSMFIFLVAVPILTMRSFAEERKSKTDQLLLTAPVSVTEIVLGKYLAMVTVYAIPCLVYCLYPLAIKAQGTAYLKTDYVAIAVFFLVGSVYIAVGMFLSSLTESQIIAAVSTFAALLVLYLWSGLIGFLPDQASYNLIGVLLLVLLVAALIYHMTRNWLIAGGIGVAGWAVTIGLYIGKSSRFEGLLATWLEQWNVNTVFSKVLDSKVLDISGIILCFFVIFLFVFLTIQTIQRRRWS